MSQCHILFIRAGGYALTHKPEEILMIENKKQAEALLPTLSQFVSCVQIEIIKAGFDLEEKQFFFDAVEALCGVFGEIGNTFSQDITSDTIAFLHYSSVDTHWYVFEKDKESESNRAPCFSAIVISCEDNYPDYLQISDLKKAGIEIDLHFKPKPLKEINND